MTITKVKLGGIPNHCKQCLLDSGSEATTVIESFFNRHFHPKGKSLFFTCGWLTLKVANRLKIPFHGYFILDVEVLGVTVSEKWTLVTRNHEDPISSNTKILCLTYWV